MSRFSRIQASLEQIDFQKSNVFFKELTAGVANLRAVINEKDSSREIMALNAIIKHHTNMEMSIEYHSDDMLSKQPMEWIALPHIDMNSALFRGQHEQNVQADSWLTTGDKMRQVFDGSIDLEDGRVTGVFAKVPVTIGFTKRSVTLNDDQELAASILHEVGHLFTYFESLVQTVTVAYVMQSCSQALAGQAEKKVRIQIIRAASDVIGGSVDAEKLAESNDPETIQTVLLKSFVDEVRSGTGASFYDLRTAEALADQYVARQGGARALALSLDKTMRAFNQPFGKPGFLAGSKFAVLEAAKWATVALFAIFPVTTLPTLCLIGMCLIDSTPAEGNYDKPGERVDRMRSDLISTLKDVSLPVSLQKSIHEDIAFLEGMSKQISDRNTFFHFIWKNLTSARRNNYTQIEFQKELEQLANNNMFLAASRLSTLNR
jgi:hypothetical protein